jgi:translation initiation factor IF-2
MVDKNDAGLRNESLEQVNNDPPQSAPSDQDSATISMQGVSGKVITGKVKIKKAKRTPKPKTGDAEKKAGRNDKAGKAETKLTPSQPKPAAETKAPVEKEKAAEKKAPLSSGPQPRKIKSGAVEAAEKAKEEAKAKTETAEKTVKPSDVKEAASSKADLETPETSKKNSETKAKESATPQKAEAKEETPAKDSSIHPIASPQPRKLGNIFEAEKKAEEKASKEEAAKLETNKEDKAKAEPKKVSEAEAKTETKPAEPAGPRKLASGGPTPKKIASAGEVEGSLAATARAFAKRKEEKQREKERQKQGRTRFTGRRQDRFSSAPVFDKDKDEEEPKFRSQSRRKKKTAPGGADMLPTKNQDGKNKFQKQTRYREFTQNDYRQREKQDKYNDLRKERQRHKQKREERQNQQPAVTHVSLPEALTVKEFAEAISRSAADVITSLMRNGVMATQNQEIDYDTAAIIAEEFGVTTSLLKEVKISDIIFDDTEDEEENLEPRPPVVSVMGHVDHGKTTLLDYIRSERVAEGEAGGITQRIGAYMTKVGGRKITFLDTPGHEAFTTMRARGAQATDMVILVVAADDGVMPQTIEAINHAKAANTDIIVAINKMDKPHANPDRVKQELAEHGLIPEEWGGSTIMVPISAKTGQGVEDLLEMVLLNADVMELKADPNKQAKGIIIEAQLDKNRGPVATLLVQRGTLHQGDTIIADTVVGNVRAMVNANGEENVPAGPSVPVEVLGLPEVPEAGSVFYVVKDEKMARAYAQERSEEEREERINRGPTVTLDNLFSQIEAGKVTNFNIIVKADVVGSVEAMSQSLQKLSNDEVRINIVHAAAGAVTETDLRLAEASDATIIAFNVRPNNKVMDMAKELGVSVKSYTVIYHAIEEVEAAMKGLLAPVFEEVIVGHVDIREIFHVSSVGTIGGAYVKDGKINRNSDVRVLRNDVIIHTGKLASLRRYENDVREVVAGYECGLSLQGFNDLEIGDVLEVFQMEEVERK